MCVCGSDKLPAAIFIRMGPNLDTTCISEMSRGTFLEFSKFWIFTPFLPKKLFLKTKIEKIQDLFSDMPCHLSNQTAPPTQHFFELFSSKPAHLAHMNSIDRFTGVTPTRKGFAKCMQKSIFSLLLYYIFFSAISNLFVTGSTLLKWNIRILKLLHLQQKKMLLSLT